MRKIKDVKRKKRNTTLGLTICCVAAIAIIGVYTFQTYKTRVNENLKQAQDELDKMEDNEEKTKPAESLHIENEESDLDSQSGKSLTGDSADEEWNDEQNGEEQNEAGNSGTEQGIDAQTDSAETGGVTASLSFGNGEKLLWPVNGDVLMNYSMDKTVYFKTLDQYKYNPALIIGGAVGDQVISSCKGVVKSIDQKADTGTTITVDIGSGYELIYGQLKDVTVNAGDYVQATTVLGYVNNPTIFYGTEGSNVYFALRKNGQAADPNDYMTEQ